MDDTQLIFDGTPNNSSERILVSIEVAADKINRVGNATIFLQVPNEARWGTWFGTGSRTLTHTHPIDAVDASLKVFPNPIQAQFQVELDLPTTAAVQIRLYDGLGRRVRQEQHAGAVGFQRFDLSSKGLPSGTYWLSIQQDGRKWGRRVVKVQQ